MEILSETWQVLGQYFLYLYLGISIGLLWYWSVSIGIVRGLFAALARVAWTLPVVLCLFPKQTQETLPRSMNLTPLHVLVDDSKSMWTNKFDARGDFRSGDMEFHLGKESMDHINSECQRLGCLPKISRLSEVIPETSEGYTYLNSGLDQWQYKIGGEPWILISDGADSMPTEPWQMQFKGLGLRDDGKKRGMILALSEDKSTNIWLILPKVTPFSFENSPISIGATIGRNQADATEVVQVQVATDGGSLTTSNVQMHPGEFEVGVTLTLPSMPRGQHLLTIRALPTANELALWDNSAHTQIEVLPNTIGVLHLLGSPSWDGRFLRRYFKGEPKYDLISFFILRDPWDSQQVSERELSLIPFPVERLFRDELPNFRAVVIQNFTLYQFLLPEYQSNLVKFVQEGGGLLFLGGPRALSSADLMSSPLRGILPFEMGGMPETSYGTDFDDFDENAPKMQPKNDHGPSYDPNFEFRVELTKPEATKRSLANVYDDWEGLLQPLSNWGTAKGLHRMDRVKFKDETSTILLNAKGKGSNSKTTIPLAVASYPGKGRALWIFSDSLWRLGMTVDHDVSRQVYNRFMQGAMTWLMRNDLRKPLVAKDLVFTKKRNDKPEFRVVLQGPSIKYFQLNDEWKFRLCSVEVKSEQINFSRIGEFEVELSGPLISEIQGGGRCQFEVEGNHQSFGSVKAAISGVYPELYLDKDLRPSGQKLAELAKLTGAELVSWSQDDNANSKSKNGQENLMDQKRSPIGHLDAWLAQITGNEGISLPNRQKIIKEFYWVFSSPWVWICLLFMPIEILIRRWESYFGRSKKIFG